MTHRQSGRAVHVLVLVLVLGEKKNFLAKLGRNAPIVYEVISSGGMLEVYITLPLFRLCKFLSMDALILLCAMNVSSGGQNLWYFI